MKIQLDDQARPKLVGWKPKSTKHANDFSTVNPQRLSVQSTFYQGHHTAFNYLKTCQTLKFKYFQTTYHLLSD